MENGGEKVQGEKVSGPENAGPALPAIRALRLCDRRAEWGRVCLWRADCLRGRGVKSHVPAHVLAGGVTPQVTDPESP